MSQAPSAWVTDVTPNDFEREVIQRSHERPVVVDFWAPWCGPCRMLGPLLERLANERAGAFVLAKVNIDEAPDLALRYAVEAIPAVTAFRGGKPVLDFVGVLPEAQVREFLDRILPTEADRQAAEAAALEPSEPAEAEKRYRQALAQDAGHDRAIVGLARLLIARGQDREAEELLERTGPGGELGEEAECLQALLALRRLQPAGVDEAAARRRVEADPENARLRYELGCVLAAGGRYPEALAQLLAAAERDRNLAGSQVREAMVKIFQVVGVRSALADEYRDKLSRLLY